MFLTEILFFLLHWMLNVLFGVFNIRLFGTEYVMNFLILLAKFNIYTSRFAKHKSNLIVFNSKAIKLKALCEESDL